ncbi:MAG: sulfatase-like hydrolase/transferase [Gammaproteobacteria bacterium]|nr:sulfatase-like hydrolase/transferase [Gammaproteobacteria bacterium]
MLAMIRNSFPLIIKIFSIIAFLVLSNLHLDLKSRIDLLWHNFGGLTGIFLFLLIWFICVASFVFLCFSKNTFIKYLFVVLILLATALDIIYGYVSHSHLNYDSFAILLEARNNLSDAISFYLIYILKSLFIISLGLFAIFFKSKSFSTFDVNKSHDALILHPLSKLLIFFMPIAVIFSLSVVRGGYGTDGLPSQYRLLGLYPLISINNYVSSKFIRSTPPEISTSEKKLNIVLVMDESVRGDYLDINVYKGITPYLYNNRDKVINFGLALSSSNCSSGSNYIMRTGASPFNFQKSIVSNPLIWDYARNAGYESHYLEIQESEGKLNNKMTLSEKNKIENFKYFTGVSRLDKDLKSIDYIKSQISRGDNSFIYVQRAGVHFPYEGSYDLRRAKYHPHMGFDIKVKSKETMVNSYKNAIAYSVDLYFKKLFNDLDLKNTLIIYTSDHGQNLYDNKTWLTHCSVENTSRYEVTVPLMIITENQEIRKQFEKSAIFNKNKTSHYNIIPTILELMGYEKEYINANHYSGLLDHQIKKPSAKLGIVSNYRFSFSGDDYNTAYKVSFEK